MISVSRMFMEGGPFMYLLLLIALAYPLLWLVTVALSKWLNFAPLLWAVTVGTVMTGLLGSVMGMMQAFDAVAHAPPDMKQNMLAAGFTLAMNTTAFSLMIAIPAAIASGLAHSVVLSVERLGFAGLGQASPRPEVAEPGPGSTQQMVEKLTAAVKPGAVAPSLPAEETPTDPESRSEPDAASEPAPEKPQARPSAQPFVETAKAPTTADEEETQIAPLDPKAG